MSNRSLSTPEAVDVQYTFKRNRDPYLLLQPCWEQHLLSIESQQYRILGTPGSRWFWSFFFEHPHNTWFRWMRKQRSTRNPPTLLCRLWGHAHETWVTVAALWLLIKQDKFTLPRHMPILPRLWLSCHQSCHHGLGSGKVIRGGMRYYAHHSRCSPNGTAISHDTGIASDSSAPCNNSCRIWILWYHGKVRFSWTHWTHSHCASPWYHSLVQLSWTTWEKTTTWCQCQIRRLWTYTQKERICLHISTFTWLCSQSRSFKNGWELSMGRWFLSFNMWIQTCRPYPLDNQFYLVTFNSVPRTSFLLISTLNIVWFVMLIYKTAWYTAMGTFQLNPGAW